MLTLKESLLSRTQSKVASTKKNIVMLSKLPTNKDWVKKGFTYYLKWNIQHIVDEWGDEYPFLKYYNYIWFSRPKQWGFVSIFLIRDDGSNSTIYHQASCQGQVGYGVGVREMKKDVMDFITSISEDPKKMEAFLFVLDKELPVDVFTDNIEIYK
jgi:hypothetical protein